MFFIPDWRFELPTLLPLAIVLVLVLRLKQWIKPPTNLPPMPRRPFPVIGHFPYLTGDVREKLLGFKKTAGDIFSIYLGGTLVVVLSSYETLTEALIKQADLFSARPIDGPMAVVGYTEGIFASTGHRWKENRSVTLAVFKQFGMGKSILAQKILEELQFFLEKLASLGGKPAYVGNITSCAVSNVSCNIVMGRRFEYDDPEYEKFIETADRIMRLLGGSFLHQWYPSLKYLPGDFFKAKALIQVDNEFMDGMKNFIHKVIREEQEGTNRDNLISEYLREMRKKQEAGKHTELSMKNLERVVFDTMVAGIETTATAFLWFSLYVIHHPSVQKKVYDEIVAEIGTDRAPLAEDKPRLNYTNAAIIETLRLANVVPWAGFHRCTAETNIRGYTIPKDTMVLPNLDSVLLDDGIWGDARNFRPDRFLQDGELVIPDHFVAFSVGRRFCMGAALAKMEMFLFIVSVIQRFEILPADPNCLPPRQYKIGATCPPLPFPMRLVERRPAPYKS